MFALTREKLSRALLIGTLAGMWSACGGDAATSDSSGRDSGISAENPDAGGSGAIAHDAGPDADIDTPDADAGGEPDEQIPTVDASFPEADGPLDLSFAETSFSLVTPSALSPLLQQASALLEQGSFFVTTYRAAEERFSVDYGAADWVTSAEVRFQFPAVERDVFLVEGAPRTYRSLPFAYRLRARIKLLGLTSNLAMLVRDAMYEAMFDGDFLTIEQGTLKGALTRRDAERSPLEPGLLCGSYCPSAFCLSHGVSSLADILDCQGTELDVDRDADGTPDAYSVEMTFTARRVIAGPHAADAP